MFRRLKDKVWSSHYSVELVLTHDFEHGFGLFDSDEEHSLVG